MNNNIKHTVLLSILTLLGGTGNAVANTVIEAVNGGYFLNGYLKGANPSTGEHLERFDPFLGGLIVGYKFRKELDLGVVVLPAATANYRTFLEYDLSGVKSQVTSATFALQVGGVKGSATGQISNSFHSDTGTERLNIMEYSGNVSDLTIDDPNSVPNLDVWTDLGDGQTWASMDITADVMDAPTEGAIHGQTLEFVLSSAAIAQLNVARLAGENWAFGITSPFEENEINQGLDSMGWDPAFVPNVFTPQLRVTTVPVPAAAWLFGSSLITLVSVRRKLFS